jgi:hypothetical protein
VALACAPPWAIHIGPLRGPKNLAAVPQVHTHLPLAPDNLSYVTLVKPGIAIVGVANGPHSYFGGVKSSVEFMA